jgi:hypothetical protein
MQTIDIALGCYRPARVDSSRGKMKIAHIGRITILAFWELQELKVTARVLRVHNHRENRG